MTALRRVWAILGKEWIQLKRDRMTFGMVVMIPLIQLLLFGYAINTNVRHIPVAVVDQSNTGLSRVLTQMITATQVVSFTERHQTLEPAQQALVSGRVRAVLVIPQDLAQRLARHPAVGLGTPRSSDEELARPLAQWLVDGSDTVVASVIKGLRTMPVGELLRQDSNQAVATFEVALFYNPEQRSAVNIVPGLVGVILTMTMILFTALAIVREYERGNMELLITTPVRPLELMLGKILPYVLFGLIQVGIILGLGHWVFAVPLAGAWHDVLGLTLLFIGASLSLGLVLSTLARSQLQAMQMTIFILLPSILLSGFMFPYEGMPKPAQWLAELLPATHFIRAIRGVLLRDADLAALAPDLIWLGLFTAAGLLLATLRFKKSLD
ncbi:ABC transporter permease [Ferrimonas marina]|uniref:ABC-2 type transport system permease protein n=1 Tax=Ferrimonas marina TaxID=299255 RepID=A0A1M5MZL5_9GAMM|nr:ABC transporter permease [Ferrimonas marina]SHG82562.1 ABC-2 type transport system permease protein [Ferrimonas marina]